MELSKQPLSNNICLINQSLLAHSEREKRMRFECGVVRVVKRTKSSRKYIIRRSNGWNNGEQPTKENRKQHTSPVCTDLNSFAHRKRKWVPIAVRNANYWFGIGSVQHMRHHRHATDTLIWNRKEICDFPLISWNSPMMPQNFSIAFWNRPNKLKLNRNGTHTKRPRRRNRNICYFAHANALIHMYVHYVLCMYSMNKTNRKNDRMSIWATMEECFPKINKMQSECERWHWKHKGWTEYMSFSSLHLNVFHTAFYDCDCARDVYTWRRILRNTTNNKYRTLRRHVFVSERYLREYSNA